MSRFARLIVVVLGATAFPFAWAAATAAQEVSPRKVTPADLRVIENSMTVDQALLFNEYLSLLSREVERELAGDPMATPVSLAELRKDSLEALAYKSPGGRSRFWERLPARMLRMRREVDPYYVSKEEREAAAKIPANAAGAVAKLLSPDVEAYVAARRTVLALGPACRALVADRARKLGAGSDASHRLDIILSEFDRQLANERRLRVCEPALQRAADLRRARADKQAKIATLVSRWVTDEREADRDNLYAALCYFNFSTGKNDYNEAVALEFGNGDNDSFMVNMVTDQDNRFVDIGLADFTSIKKAPDAKVMAGWKRARRDEDLKAVVGHVYLEHCLRSDRDVDFTVKFKVLDLKPGEWVVIEWERIPQEK